jgi:hypothetical protein
VTELLEKFDEVTLKQVANWPDEEILSALEAARNRISKPPAPNFFKASLDQKGMLQITFKEKIDLPAYLLREILSMIDQNA